MKFSLKGRKVASHPSSHLVRSFFQHTNYPERKSRNTSHAPNGMVPLPPPPAPPPPQKKKKVFFLTFAKIAELDDFPKVVIIILSFGPSFLS